MSHWFEIKNDAGDVFIYDEIGGYGITAKNFIDQLPQTTGSLNVRVNSLGGSVFEGFAIYQALRDHPADITVYVDGIAASIASVIAMAGDKVIMSASSQMMIHEGHVEAYGDAEKLSRAVDLLETASNTIASVYAARCGGTPDEWRSAMKAETWYTAEEALKAGLADEVIKETKRSARNTSEFSIFNYAGRDFAPAPKTIGVKNNESATPLEINIDIDSLDKSLKAALGKVEHN